MVGEAGLSGRWTLDPRAMSNLDQGSCQTRANGVSILLRPQPRDMLPVARTHACEVHVCLISLVYPSTKLTHCKLAASW